MKKKSVGAPNQLIDLSKINTFIATLPRWK
jgi:hypothetical protein